jgi:hypothetical protein
MPPDVMQYTHEIFFPLPPQHTHKNNKLSLNIIKALDIISSV